MYWKKSNPTYIIIAKTSKNVNDIYVEFNNDCTKIICYNKQKALIEETVEIK